MESEDKKPIFTKKLVLGILAVILIVLIVFLLLRNCSGGAGGEYSVSYVSVSPTETGLGIGDTIQLMATVSPMDAKNQTVFWSSSNDMVATVDATTGIVTGVGEGTATITARSEDGGHTGNCIVTVSKKLPSLEGIQLTSSKYSLKVGRSVLVEVRPAPTDAQLPELVYTTSDSTIATVSENGILKGINVGTTTLIVTTLDGAYSARATVVVTKNDPAQEDPVPTTVKLTSLSFSTTSPKQVCVGTPIQLIYVGSPNNATDKTVTWTIDNPTDKDKMINKYASITQNGVITGKAAGTVKVTITSKENNKLYSIETIKVLSKSSSACSSGTPSGETPSGGTPSNDSPSTSSSTSAGVTCTVSYTKGNGDWYKKFNVAWSFTPSAASDDGYSERKYCIDSSCTSFSYEYAKSLQSGTTRYIFGYSYVDKDGKTKTGKCNPSVVTYVDTVKPTCTITASKDNGKIIATVHATDKTSGIAKVQLNGSTKSYSGTANYDVDYSQEINFDNNATEKQASAIVYDAAGHDGTCSITIKADGNYESARYIKEISLTVDTANSVIAGESKSFRAYYVMSSGAATYPAASDFTVKGGSVSGSNGSYTFTADAGDGVTKGSISLNAIGYNGKKLSAGPKEFNITKETEAPDVNLEVTGTSNNNWYRGAVTVKANVSYSLSTQKTKTIKVCVAKGSTCTPSNSSVSLSASAESGLYRVYYELITTGGAKYSGLLGYVRVDNTKPTCSIQKSGTKSIVTFADENSGIESVKLCGGSSQSPNTTQKSIHTVTTADCAGKTASVTDKAGNSNSCNFDAASELKASYVHLASSDITLYVSGSKSNYGFTLRDAQGNILPSTVVTSSAATSSNNTCFTTSATSSSFSLTPGNIACTGKLTLTANGLNATAVVTVKERTVKISDKTLGAGDSAVISATITPYISNSSVTWTSSNTNCATIDSTGKVTAKRVINQCTTTITGKVGASSGSATITVKPLAGEDIRITITRASTADTWSRLVSAGNISVNAPANSTVSFDCGNASCGATGTVGSGRVLNRGFSVPSNGTYEINVKVVTPNGTTKTAKEKYSYSKIDRTVPTCTSITYTNGTIRAKFSDTGSGIMTFLNNTWNRISATEYTKATGLAVGTNSITVRDYAGNEGTCSIKLALQAQSKMDTCSAYANYNKVEDEESTGTCTDTSSKAGTQMSYHTCETKTSKGLWRYNNASYYLPVAGRVVCSVSASGYAYATEAAAVSACTAKCTNGNSTSGAYWSVPCTATQKTTTYTVAYVHTAQSCNAYGNLGTWKNISSISGCNNGFTNVYGKVSCRTILVKAS